MTTTLLFKPQKDAQGFFHANVYQQVFPKAKSEFLAPVLEFA